MNLKHLRYTFLAIGTAAVLVSLYMGYMSIKTPNLLLVRATLWLSFAGFSFLSPDTKATRFNLYVGIFCALIGVLALYHYFIG